MIVGTINGKQDEDVVLFSFVQRLKKAPDFLEEKKNVVPSSPTSPKKRTMGNSNRCYELARVHNCTSPEIIRTLKQMGFEMKNAHQNLERDGRYACTVVYARETAPGTRQNMPEDTKIKVEDWLQSMLVKEFGASINVNPYFFGGEPVEGMSSASLAMVAADITKRQETLSIENGLLILNPS